MIDSMPVYFIKRQKEEESRILSFYYYCKE